MREAEEKSEIAVNLFIPFQFPRGLNALPGRCDFDEDALFWDADRLVESDQLFCLYMRGD